MCTLTIFTPTYNRAYILGKAYKSLIDQTNKDFEWLIVDGVSTDETKELVDSFISSNQINIQFEENVLRSKYSAILNHCIPNAKGEIILFLDSDDFLAKDAVEKIIKAHEKYKNNDDIAGYFFMCEYLNGFELKPLEHEKITHSMVLGQTRADKVDACCQIYKTNCLREFKYPVYKNENFTPESVIWNTIDLKYKIVSFNEVIYFREYLNDGYTKNGRKKNLENPLSSMHSAEFLMSPLSKFKYKIKGSILYACYGFFGEMTLMQIVKKTKYKFLVVTCGIPIGSMLYVLWKKKYEIDI